MSPFLGIRALRVERQMKTSALGLSIAVVAFGASTIYLAVQLTEERAHSEQLAEAARALNTRIAELERARAEPRNVMSRVFGGVNTMSGATLRAAPQTPAPAAGESSPSEVTVMNGPPLPAQSAAFEKMIRSQMRAQNKRLYADVGADLGLSRQDASKLVDLITDQQVGGVEVSREIDPAERVRMVNEAQRENEAKIAELLGPEKLRQLQQYQQTIPARQELNVLAQQLEASDAPALSGEQRQRLLTALGEERNRIPMPTYSPGTKGEDFRKASFAWQDDYDERIAAQFRGILSTEQYTAYDQYQQWHKEVNAQMRNSAGPDDTMFFRAVAPGTIVGETAILTTTSEATAEDATPKQP
jgi:hypothetical protein